MAEAAVLLAVVAGVGELVRRLLSAGRVLTVAAQAVTVLVLLAVVFVRDRAIAGFLPGPEAVAGWQALLEAGAQDVGRYAIPAPPTDGIRLMLVGGVLLVGLVVDALAVTARTAAPAGLPLLALYSVAAGLSGGKAVWQYFLLAAAGYLLLLLAEGRDRLTRWGRVLGGPEQVRASAPEARPGPPAGGTRFGRRIGVLALGAALAVPAVLPSLDGGLLDGLGTGGGGSGGGGTINAVNPLVSLQDNLVQPEDREVIRYSTDAPDSTGMYLRMVAMDEFDGTTWRASRRDLQDVPGTLPRPDGLREDVAVREVTTDLSVSDDFDPNWLPMPFPASQVAIEGRWRYEPAGRLIVGDKGQTGRGAGYTVRSLVVEPTREQLAAAPPAPEALRREYTRVPDSLPPDVKDTALEVTRGAGSDYERAVRLQDWFTVKGGFRYDVSVSSGTGVEAISRFLEQREGFCVHFSFAMAAMSRTLGIPARVAVGFTPGSPQADGTKSVGIRDAHAWPELYFEGVGWTRFEPTPSRGTTPEYTRAEAPVDDTPVPEQPEQSAQAVPSQAPSRQQTCPPEARGLGECGQDQDQGAAPAGGSGFPLGPVLLIAAGTVLLVLLPVLPLLWRRRARSRRLAGPPGRTEQDAAARVLAVWREVEDTAWDYGIPPDGSHTPRRAAERVVRLGGLTGDAAAAAHRMGGTVEQVLYAPRPRPAGSPAEDAARIRAGLRAAAGRGVRLRAELLPRSSARVLWALSDTWLSLSGRLSAARTRVTVRITAALPGLALPGRRRG
ncbi:transglutaminase TgpA family protein [Streptomyces solincola]|uniref:transglutaminase TgpA family protein n=1 Tax=Streptomyces solincola TaxID=2100817 RepID=UPI002159297F|nr:DUF3488 and transglutaminase-like domain-containing protein [Streptomyces solincola]